MTLDEARERVGLKVVYRAAHIQPYEAGEEGVITSVGPSYVFVRFGADYGSKATAAHMLEPVSI